MRRVDGAWQKCLAGQWITIPATSPGSTGSPGAFFAVDTEDQWNTQIREAVQDPGKQVIVTIVDVDPDPPGSD